MMIFLVAVFIFAGLVHNGYASGGADIRVCDQSQPYLPRTVVNTTARITKLREEMEKEGLAAYIIPSTDAHGSEYVKERDKRRQFISGFSGSAGTAIVTKNNGSALWTDGRYFLQAEMQLDCNWILQRSGKKGVPSQSNWLKMVLKSGDVVGIDPFLRSIQSWDWTVKSLNEKNITLKGIQRNLVDAIWKDRPAEEVKKVVVQKHEYTGKFWYTKVKDVQKKMKEVGSITAHVLQSLDSIAWLLNLRGAEISYNPVFFSYVVVKEQEVLFFVNDAKISSQKVRDHLQLGKCTGKSYCIKTKPYNSTVKELEKISNSTDGKIWFSPTDSHALRQHVADDKVHLDYSPIILMKAKKNKEELQGMKSANLKDSVALSQFFMYAEEQVAKGEKVTELSLDAKMIEFRSNQSLYRGLSFASIIGYGSNSAIIHYISSKETDKNVTDKSTLLVDTGSHYLDGTTDVTRTVHFGTPTAKQKSAFTRVLMGHINLAMTVFPEGTYGRDLDIFAREPLFANGWNYRHGTGHGIGSYLFIHEGPGWFASAGCPSASEKPLEIGFVITDEPGYYEDGNFGVRIETALTVVDANTPNHFGNVSYYKFEPICYFPIQRKLIDETIMSDVQLKWLNDYHKKTAEIVGPELKKQKKTKEYHWFMKQTQPIGNTVSSATTVAKSISLILAPIMSQLCIYRFRF